MLKLKWQQRLHLWLWQQRRMLILLCASLLTIALTLSYNVWLMSQVPELTYLVLLILTFGQLGVAGLVVVMVLIVSD